MLGGDSPRFKRSLIKKSLFILIVYSRSSADEVTWPSIWERVQYIIKTKHISGKETNTELSKLRWIRNDNKYLHLFSSTSFYLGHTFLFVALINNIKKCEILQRLIGQGLWDILYLLYLCLILVVGEGMMCTTCSWSWYPVS